MIGLPIGAVALSALPSQGERKLVEKTHVDEQSGKPAFRAKKTPAAYDAPLLAPEGSDVETVVLVDEDFSAWNDGSQEEPMNGIHVEGFFEDPKDPWVISKEYTKQYGWTGESIYLADGACGLYSEGWGGWIQTPQGDYSGHLVITFKAKVPEIVKAKKPYVSISLLKGKITNGVRIEEESQKYIYFETDHEWHEYSWEYDLKYGSSDAFIQFCTYNELLLDDIKIVSELTTLPTPLLKKATDFTYDGFTANWGEVARATDYQLTCYRKIPKDDGDYLDCDQDFESLKVTDGHIDNADTGLPEGWAFNLGENGDRGEVFTEPENVASGKYAICFDADNDVIEIPDNGALITEFSVKMRFVEGKIEIPGYDVAYYPGMVTLEGWNGYKGMERL